MSTCNEQCNLLFILFFLHSFDCNFCHVKSKPVNFVLIQVANLEISKLSDHILETSINLLEQYSKINLKVQNK